MHSSSYQAFQKEISKEIWISKLGRGTHPGAANIFHELSVPDDQINLNEFTYKPLQIGKSEPLSETVLRDPDHAELLSTPGFVKPVVLTD